MSIPHLASTEGFYTTAPMTGAVVERGGLVTDVLYVLLTVVVFAVLALIVRGVERL